MQRLRILVILILLSLMPLYSLAVLNEGQYAFRSLDINNGLSQNTVHAILQDKQGFMWFGTKDGLDRYDGISFRTFMKESGTLGNNFITSLYEDNLGQIWIGTDVGLYVYCPQMEKVRHFTLISNSNIDIDCTVNLITGDQKGGIWVVTQTRGIFYYNPQDSQLVNYQSDGSGTLNLKTSGQLYFDSDDVCWLDIRDGNLYYSKDKLKTLTPIFPEDSKVSFRDEYIYKLLPGPYNCMYVGTVFGLKEVNLTNKTIRTLLSKDELGGDIYIRELAFYSDDELWIGTESGLYIYNLHTAKIIHLQNVNGDPYSISDNAIYSILKDREGGMWIGTYFGGVNYYPRQYTYGIVQMVMRKLLEILFQSASLVIDTIRTFFLIVLSILGPIAFALSVFDGLQNTLVQWLARYISVYLWLPVADLFGAMLAKIQTLILQEEMNLMADPMSVIDVDGSSAIYLIFMVIGIIGYFCVPTVSNWIVQAGGMSAYNRNVNNTTSKVTNVAGAAAGASTGNVGAVLLKK